MAKLKPASKRKKASPAASAVPCLVLVLLGILLMSVLFYLFVSADST